MANNLSVKITAEIVDLQTKFGIARAEVSGLTSEFNKLARASAAGTISSADSAKLQQVAAAMLQARQHAADLSGQLEKTGASFANFGARAAQSTGGVGGALDALKGKFSAVLQFTGIAVGIAAFEKLSQAITQLGERAAEMRSTADVIGVTVEQLQAMTATAEGVGVSGEILVRFTERLVGLLQQAREGSGAADEKLKLLGLTNQQIASSTFGANDALAALHARLTDASTAQQTQNQILAEFGPRGANAIAVLKAYSGSEADVAARMQALNGLNAEQAASAASTYATYREFGTYLENTFTKALDATIEGVSRTASVLLSTPAKSPALQGSVEVPSVAPQVQADASKAQAALQTVEVTAHAVTLAELNAIRDTVSAYASGTAERLAAMQHLASAAKEFYPTADADKLREINRELATETQAYAAAQIRGIEQVTQKERESADITKRLVNEELEASQRYLTQQQEIVQADAESSIAINRLKLQAQMDELSSEVTAHKITAAQKLATAQQLTRELAELDKQQVENEIAALDPETAAYERAANKIKEIEAKLNLDLAALKKQFVAESGKDADEQAKQWQKAVGEIENAESTLTSDLLSRRKSLSQSLLGVAQQLVQQEISNDLRAMTTRLLLYTQGDAAQKSLEQGGYLYHAATELMKTKDTTTQGAARTAAATAAAVQQETATATAAAASRATSSAIGTQQVMSDAAVAAAGSFASVAAIPFVGWAMAPGVGEAAFATVSAYAPMAALAEGTPYVPRTGLYQLHQGEAVAPVPFAQRMRSAMSADGGGGTQQHNYHIQAMDASSFRDLLRKPANRAMIKNEIRRHVRGGR